MSAHFPKEDTQTCFKASISDRNSISSYLTRVKQLLAFGSEQNTKFGIHRSSDGEKLVSILMTDVFHDPQRLKSKKDKYFPLKCSGEEQESSIKLK